MSPRRDIFGEARSLVSGPPSSEAFDALIKLIAEEPPEDLLDYLQNHLQRWPQEIPRWLPRRWAPHLVQAGELPAAARLANAINLSFRDLRDAAIDALTSSTWTQSLHSLNLNGNKLSARGVQTLLDWPALEGLWGLNLSNNSLGSDGARLLIDAPALAQLQRLALRGCDLSWSFGDRLAQSQLLLQLQHLNLGNNQLVDAGILPLTHGLETRGPGQLTELHLDNCQLSAESARAIAQCFGLNTLQILNLGQNAIGDPGAQHIAESYYTSKLRKLQLFGCGLADEGAAAIARAQNLGALVELCLDDNQIGDRGAEAIAESNGLSSLHTLSLDQNNIGDGGAHALVASKQLYALRELVLDSNTSITDEAIIKIAKDPGLGRLKKLSLSFVFLTSRAAEALAASTHTENLRELALDFRPGEERAALEALTSSTTLREELREGWRAELDLMG